MKELKKELEKKRYELYKILKEQDKKKNLSYKVDEERKLIREIIDLDNKIMEAK